MQNYLTCKENQVKSTNITYTHTVIFSVTLSGQITASIVLKNETLIVPFGFFP